MPSNSERKRSKRADNLITEIIIPAISTFILLFCLIQLAICLFQAEQNLISDTMRNPSPVISAFAS